MNILDVNNANNNKARYFQKKKKKKKTATTTACSFLICKQTNKSTQIIITKPIFVGGNCLVGGIGQK